MRSKFPLQMWHTNWASFGCSRDRSRAPWGEKKFKILRNSYIAFFCFAYITGKNLINIVISSLLFGGRGISLSTYSTLIELKGTLMIAFKIIVQMDTWTGMCYWKTSSSWQSKWREWRWKIKARKNQSFTSSLWLFLWNFELSTFLFFLQNC